MGTPTGESHSSRRLLASIRFQETGQRPEDAAQAIVEYLTEGAGRVVDTSDTPDAMREIVIVGYLADGPGAEEFA